MTGPYDELVAAPLPPWLQHPEIPYGSIGWRTGYGDDTMVQWGTWYAGRSPSAQQSYQARYPEPRGWQGFYAADDEA